MGLCWKALANGHIDRWMLQFDSVLMKSRLFYTVSASIIIFCVSLVYEMSDVLHLTIVLMQKLVE